VQSAPCGAPANERLAVRWRSYLGGVRALFTVYLVFVLVGLAYFITIGLTHH
jgi:hypothetical protein